MSIANGFFTAHDGETIKMAFVIAVEPLVGANGHSYYEVQLVGGQHVTIKESYLSRAAFLAAWQAI